jgi:hypothetical protein
MNKIFKEPLLHFLLIGAAFFLLFDLVGPKESNENTIVIDESDLDEVVSKFETQWKRLPTEEELTAIIEKRVEQEVFYQEALKMNLDHNDEIIKRRLSQKMEFLSDDLSNSIEPTTNQLQEYYEAHIDKYLIEPNYTLYQIYFSPDLREDWRADAKSAASEMNAMSMDKALSMGDPIALPQFFERTSEFHVSRQMGSDFTEALENIEEGSWQGPIESGYGAHVVYIKERVEEHPASFEEVINQVLEDYNFEQQKEVRSNLIKELRKSYSIQLDVQSESYSEKFISDLRGKLSFE